MTRQPARLAVTAVCLAVLACSSSGGPGPDAAATVNALNGYVQQTLTAQALHPPSPSPAKPSAVPTATARPTDAPLPTALPTAMRPSLTPPPLPTATVAAEPARPNGSVYHAAYTTVAPVVDGNLGEWNALAFFADTPVYRPENWSGVTDNSASFSLAWDTTNLYLAAIVMDDVHVQTQHGALIFKGDSLEILLDADLGGDYDVTHLNADDFQLGLSPGALNGDQPEAYLWFPADRAGSATLPLAAQPDGQGYRLEAAIPWALFNLGPTGGNRYGFVLSASDDDTPGAAEQQSLVASVSTRKLVDPTSWGTLALDK
jgi:hypothetical protein